MAEEKQIKINIEAKDSTGTAFEAVEEKLNGIKRQFGRRGIFGDLGEILVGGGIIGGVTFLAKSIGEAADKAKELADSFREGAISSEELVADLVRSIPVLGQITTMWDKIFEAADAVFNNPDRNRKDIERGVQSGEFVKVKTEAEKADEQQQREIREQIKEKRDKERDRRQKEMDREKERHDDRERDLDLQVARDVAQIEEHAQREQEKEREERWRRLKEFAEDFDRIEQRRQEHELETREHHAHDLINEFQHATQLRKEISEGKTSEAVEQRFGSGRAERFRERVGDPARRAELEAQRKLTEQLRQLGLSFATLTDVIKSEGLNPVILN